MEGIEISYETQFSSQMILNENAKDQPILYGFLGNEITFLMIKATYGPSDTNWQFEEEQYIEYYFGNDITNKKYMSKLLILTGNSLKRIPQIYLNNPSLTQKVHLEILMANLSQPDLVIPETLFTNLYYNNVISDYVLYNNPISTGSSSLYITDINDNIQLSIPLGNINTIERTNDGTNTLIIKDNNNKILNLQFLNDFNMKQAHSRISWLLEDIYNRYLTKILPTLDIDSPVITWEYGINPSGYTIISTGDTTYIIDTFINNIIDDRDGIINKYDIDVIIYPDNDFIPITEITESGKYTIYFNISDIAGNLITNVRYAEIN